MNVKDCDLASMTEKSLFKEKGKKKLSQIVSILANILQKKKQNI